MVMMVHEARASPYIFFSAGLGMFLTTMWTGQLGHRFRRELLASTGLLLAGLAMLGFTFVASQSDIHAPAGPSPPTQTLMVVVGMAILLGIGGTLAAVAIQTTVQERAPRDIRGRVISAEFLIANITGLIPMLLISGLADVIGIPRVLAGLSTVVLVSALLSFRVRPARRDA